MTSDEDRLTVLLSKCKLNGDVDTKLDAIIKLQAEFEAGVELSDIDGLIAALKICLRTPNQHLTSATLSTIIPLFPLLVQHHPSTTFPSSSNTSNVESAILRQALNAFLPSGGIIERLGDNREKTREKAKEALIAIGGVVFKASGQQPLGPFRGKGSESPQQIYERSLREQGLVSRSWRVREQCILILVQLRRNHPLFPLRPFVPLLVDALEDSDGAVRDCARQSVIEIFAGHGVTDAARSDLKKEMTKKGVRKAIVDSVLNKLLGGEGRNTPSSDGVEGKEESLRPSSDTIVKPPAFSGVASGCSSQEMAPNTDRPPSRTGDASLGDTDVFPVYIASTRDLENEFLHMLPHFEGKESEHNWLARERAVVRIRGMLKGQAHLRYPETFVAGLKNGVIEGTLKALSSLRTTVAACTCSLYADLAVSLGSRLDVFVETLLTPLLKMAALTKKIIATQSQDVVDVILIHTSCHPRQSLPLLWTSIQEKTVQARAFAVGHVKVFVDCHGLRSKHVIDSTGGAELLDKCVRKSLVDPNPGVRERARSLFWSFEAIWKDRGLTILESLDAVGKKQLQNASPVPLEEPALSKPSTPASKKSSVAAAIAASRTKAKRIAMAPPTLRHQATATSQAQASRATSPPVPNKRSVSPLATTGSSPSSPRAESPSSPPSRLFMRNTTPSPAVVRYDHQKTRTPSVSSSPSPPSSPTNATHRRHVSSPLVARSLDRGLLRQDAPTSHVFSSNNPSQSFSPRTSSALRSSLGPMPSAGQVGSSLQDFTANLDDSLLMATTVPLTSDSDPTDDDSVNLMTFSAPWELSRKLSHPATSLDSTPSLRSTQIPNSIVEDALRARAAQAESAAEQLLELVDPDDTYHLSPIPPSLLPSDRATLGTSTVPPTTPINQTSAVMRHAALFKDSPVYRGDSPSIFEVIRERKHQTGWWLKRMRVLNQGHSPSADFTRLTKLEEYTVDLEKGVADASTLRNLTILCHRNPYSDSMSPPTSPIFPNIGPLGDTPTSSRNLPPPPMDKTDGNPPAMLDDIWEGGKRAERLFNALCTFLQPDRDRQLLEYGLFVLWEMLPHLDGRDTDILALLLRLRYAQDFNIDEGTLTIRDAQVELMDERNYTLYGLSTMDLCLRNFLTQPIPPYASRDSKLRAHAFGLITMAKFIIKLPADILEEEIPKIKLTLTDAYLSSEAIVRQAATTAITAAQVILQDETHLFALLEPLPDEKKNLLTYFFEKNHARGVTERVGEIPGGSGMEMLSKEMDRLDQRISTPPKHQGL